MVGTVSTFRNLLGVQGNASFSASARQLGGLTEAVLEFGVAGAELRQHTSRGVY